LNHLPVFLSLGFLGSDTFCPIGIQTVNSTFHRKTQ
jgi:hypothetical protein